MTQEWEWDGQGWLQNNQNWRWRAWTPDENNIEQIEVPSTSNEMVQKRNAGTHRTHHDDRAQTDEQEASESKESNEGSNKEPTHQKETHCTGKGCGAKESEAMCEDDLEAHKEEDTHGTSREEKTELAENGLKVKP